MRLVDFELVATQPLCIMMKFSAAAAYCARESRLPHAIAQSIARVNCNDR